MNTQRVEALEVVADDLRDARAYYDSWRSDGSDYIQKQFRELLTWIEWNPGAFPEEVSSLQESDYPQYLFRSFLCD